MEVLLNNSKKYYKANMHTHSVHSDGKLTVEKIKKAYKDRGYSIVAFTDHDVMVDNSHLNDKDFLTITSCEVGVREAFVEAPPQNATMKNMHFNLYAKNPQNVIDFYQTVLKELPDIHKSFPPETQMAGRYEKVHCDFDIDCINKIIKLANSKGFLVCFNHPTWNLQTPYEYLNLENLFAVEIYNHSANMDGLFEDEIIFDQMLKAGKHIYCMAADDSHNWKDFDCPDNDSFGGWIVINADNLEYETIITALEKGNFYASTGPDILSLKKENDKVYVETSPCQKIALITKGRRRSTIIADKNSTINCAEFNLNSFDGYFMIKVIDEYGKAAYSQAYSI